MSGAAEASVAALSVAPVVAAPVDAASPSARRRHHREPGHSECSAERHGARDTTQRRKAYEELGALSPKPSQGQGSAAPIPEKSLIYRLAKKWFFNDFGVYRNLKN